MKTAMQELIEQMHPNFFTEEEKKFWIEKEKQQIIEAYKQGWKNPSVFRENGSKYYYDNTYDNEAKTSH